MKKYSTIESHCERKDDPARAHRGHEPAVPPDQVLPRNSMSAIGTLTRTFIGGDLLLRGATAKDTWSERLRHFAYAAGWKKFEPLWDFIIRARRVATMLP